MRAFVLAAASAGLVAVAPPARAQSFPARSGETGIIDVPDAEVVGEARGQLGVELGIQRVAGGRADLSGLPMYVVGSLARNFDLGLTMREFAQPGDPLPARMSFGAAAKLQLLAPTRSFPGIAISTVLDRFNDGGILGARLALSTSALPVRVAAFGGAEARDASSIGATAGAALSVFLTKRIELAAEALTSPRGENFGGALRFALRRTTGVSIGANWFPGDDAFRVALTLAFAPQPAKPTAAPSAPTAPVVTEKIADATAPRFSDDRPRFRLRLPTAGALQLGTPRRVQYGPFIPSVAAAAAAKPAAAPVRAAAPSLEDLAELQLKEQEALADARERRVRGTAEQLEGRERASSDETRKLEERERDLASREQQIDARDKRIAVRGPPTQQERQLESLEAQLASQERNLGAQERSYGPALDAARGREREAAAREDAERQEANRLAASVSGATSRALQIEIRKQANGARNRQLAAFEARLVAKGEYIDALERQLRTKAERLDAWSRRLDTRAERLELLEKRAAEPKTPPVAPKAPPVGAAPPKDKAVFVMVVKSPTAIVKERAAAPGAAAGGTALHPGVAVEKAVAAATVVMFPTPASQLSELDRETIENIAKLAAKERCELLIWARAKDPGLMGEAQKRAAEIRTLALASGRLDASQVVTRITTRPGAQGVDVVVSALRESAKPAAAPAAAPQVPGLLGGESGKRQIREAVQGAQKSIEACVGDLIEAKKLARAEGVLKLTVGPGGRVTQVTAGAGDLSGAQMEECLNAAAKEWLFPPAEGEYVVDVPITVIRGGAK